MDTYAVPVNLTTDHIRHNTRSRELAERNLVLAPRFADEALRMDLVIRRHHGAGKDARFSASARLPLPGRDIHATAVHSDLYAAIVQLIERLARRSQHSKTRAENTVAPRRIRKAGKGRASSKLSSPRQPSVSQQESVLAHQQTPAEWTQTGEFTLGGPVHAPAHFLLTVDYTKPSGAVTRTAAALAAKTGARLTLLHVLEPVANESEILARWKDFPEQRQHYARARLQAWARDHATPAHASCSVTEGRPWEEIVRYAAANKVDMIVMGRSGSRWFGRLTARTVERVAQHSQCPVLIVGQNHHNAPFNPTSVVLTTDLSADSLEAFPWAERIARRYDAQILLANVQDPMALPGTSTYSYFHREIDEQRRQADEKLASLRHSQLAADLDVHTRVLEGLPAPALCRLVERNATDLVVMATHGAKGWVEKWLGGTAEGVLRNVTCSVLVVPPRRPQAEVAQP